MTDLNLPALKKLAEAVTPGPWWEDSEHCRFVRSHSVTYVVSKSSNQWSAVDEADIKFIAAARSALPQLIERIDFLEGRLKEADLGWKKDLDENTALKADVERYKEWAKSFDDATIVPSIPLIEHLKYKAKFDEHIRQNKECQTAYAIENHALRSLLKEVRIAMNVAPTCLQSKDQDLFEMALERIDAVLGEK